jgi:3-oxosteroid 1-dehydrogenase
VTSDAARSAIAWDEEYDLVVVGSGLAGMAAAVRASVDTGLRVLVVEKTDLLGGTAAFSGGQIWLPGNDRAAECGIVDSIEEGVRYVTALAVDRSNETLTRTVLTNGLEAARYFEREMGLRLHLLDFPDYYYPSAPGSLAKGRYLEPDPVDPDEVRAVFPRLRRPEVTVDPTVQHRATAAASAPEGHLSAGAALMAWFVASAARLRVRMRTACPLRDLVMEDGSIVGVQVSQGHEVRNIRANSAVLVATGGYDWNLDLMRMYEGIRSENYGSAAPPGNDGDGLVIAAAHGALVATLPPHQAPMQLGYQDGVRSDGLPKWHAAGASPHGIIVNRSGHRFADESFYPQINAHLHHYDAVGCSYRNWPAFLIFDQTYRDLMATGALSADAHIREGLAAQADDLRALGERAGIDPDGLEREVERWNTYDAAGKDEDFHRGEIPWTRPRFNVASLGAIETPPFYAIELGRIGYGSPSAGLAVDEFCRVLRYGGAPIPGLYAAGNVVARLDVGFLFQSGLANGRAMGMGYAVAKSLLA